MPTRPRAFRTLLRPARFPDVVARRTAEPSVTAVYRRDGIGDHTRAVTGVEARRASGAEAAHLEQSPFDPVIVTEKADVDAEIIPIEYNETVWAATRVRFRFPGPSSADFDGDAD